MAGRIGRNRTEFAHAKKIWETSYIENTELFSTDKGWIKMKNRIHQNPAKKPVQKRQLYPQVMRIAASLLILLSIGALIYWFAGTSQYIKVTAENQKIISPITLPDGTKVCLNVGGHTQIS